MSILESALVINLPVILAGVLIGLGLLGLLLPLRPARLLAGMGLLHAGLIFLLLELAARYGGAGWFGGDIGLSGAGLAARLHGLALAVLVMGLLFAAMLAAVLIALDQRAGTLQTQALDDLARREWLVWLGRDLSGEDPSAVDISGRDVSRSDGPRREAGPAARRKGVAGMRS
ncbi:hypothetical protein Thiowin_01236 [Thiorhodovibrio winogradskyi]|uniref:NADH-quinone oxidoreductase subunit K n=1 Tax=Thiorhodovibrio winogradskyi TaxID=77007 RepID=A0ABZ0S5J8_9GAMM|nr:hypothetical protein [Thiorhodovibrio winogradskyi]